MSSATTTSSSSPDNNNNNCRLLALPAELRNRIWAYTVQGDSGVIHMDHQEVWGSIELAPRLNISLACKQIRREMDLMFYAANTFLFQTRDNRSNYGVIDNLADWLYTLTDQQRQTVGKIVICSKQPHKMVGWAWTCAKFCEMDFGFDVGARIDQELLVEQPNGTFESEGHESWGREDGHFCNKGHYLLVPKKKRASKKKQGKKAVENVEL